MNEFDRMYSNISAFKLGDFLEKWFKDNEKFVTELNKERLNKFGTDVEGEKIQTYNGAGFGTGSYSPTTIAEKKRKGQIYKHVTIKDTGKAHDSMGVDADNSGFAVTMDEDKPDGQISDNLDLPKALGIEDITPITEKLTIDLRKEILSTLRA